MLQNEQDRGRVILTVVVNQEGQYSIWPAELALPIGWVSDGYEGTEEECLTHIESVWTDMMPASLRKDTTKPKP